MGWTHGVPGQNKAREYQKTKKLSKENEKPAGNMIKKNIE